LDAIFGFREARRNEIQRNRRYSQRNRWSPHLSARERLPPRGHWGGRWNADFIIAAFSNLVPRECLFESRQ
jgi:hypothetical protein